MPVKVTRVNRNLLNGPNIIHLIQQNDHINDNEERKLSNDSTLKDISMRSSTLLHTPIYPFADQMINYSSINRIENIYPIDYTKYKNKYVPILTTSSMNKSLTSFNNITPSSKFSITKPMIDYKKQPLKNKSHRYVWPILEKGIEISTRDIGLHRNDRKKRQNRNRLICPICSNCCCFASTIASLLFLTGLAALLIYTFTNQHITTTTVTTISSTSITSSTTTSTTSITTTTSTSSTSSTSTTSQTTTTSKTTTSTSTTSTSPTPPCVASFVGSASTLYSTSYTNLTSYTCFAYQWISPTTGAVTLAFQLRNDPSYWSLDDVSIYAGADQMIINGGFETGSLSPWVITLPYGSCGGSGAQVTNSSPHSGIYALVDGSSGCADEISQEFNATAGELYVVSFWLKSGSVGGSVSAIVTLS